MSKHAPPPSTNLWSEPQLPSPHLLTTKHLFCKCSSAGGGGRRLWVVASHKALWMDEQLVPDTSRVVSCLDPKTLILVLVGVNKGLELGDRPFRQSLNVLIGLMWHSGMSLCSNTCAYNCMGTCTYCTSRVSKIRPVDQKYSNLTLGMNFQSAKFTLTTM